MRSHVTIAGGELDAFVVVLEGVEELAELLLGNAHHVVQTDFLEVAVVLLQFLQHLGGVGVVGGIGLEILEGVRIGLHHKVLEKKEVKSLWIEKSATVIIPYKFVKLS